MAPDLPESQSRAFTTLITASFQKKSEPKNVSLGWRPAPSKVGKKAKTCPYCDFNHKKTKSTTFLKFNLEDFPNLGRVWTLSSSTGRQDMTGQITATIVALRPFHAQTWISFNSSAGHYSGRHFFGHNLPVAREVFKSSTDSARRLVSTKKKHFQFCVWGFLGGRHEWGYFCVFVVNFTRPWAPIQRANFWLKVCLETRLSSESLEPLVGFLTYLEPKLWPQKQKLVNISSPTKAILGFITPIMYMTITRCQNMLESCSSPLKTHEVLI